MLDTKSAELNYEYEELTPLPPSRRRRRLEELAPAVVAQAGEEAIMVTGQDKPAEMIGSNERVVDLSGGNVDTHVRLAQTIMETVRVRRELESFGDARIEPDRVFLKLENVRGGNDAAVFYVYVGLPEETRPGTAPGEPRRHALLSSAYRRPAARQAAGEMVSIKCSRSLTSSIRFMLAEILLPSRNTPSASSRVRVIQCRLAGFLSAA